MTKTPETFKDGGIAKRKCLACGKLFQSAWKGNRICTKCKKGHARLGPIVEPISDSYVVHQADRIIDRG